MSGRPQEAVTVDIGDGLSLPCGVSGTPTPSVSWFREGIQIDSSFVMADGTLVIANVTKDDVTRDGVVYYCVATNNIGPDSTTVASLRSNDVTVRLTCK